MFNKISIEKLKEVEAEFGSFDVGQVGGSNEVYLRFGYWGRVDVGALQNVLGARVKVTEDDDYDDDCGWLYSYKLG